MEIPESPHSTIGMFVISNRDSDRIIGRIEKIGPESDRPFVRWSGSNGPIVCEWRHIDLQPDLSSYISSIRLSTEQALRAVELVRDLHQGPMPAHRMSDNAE
jgi:hypothetical protein